MSSGLAMGAVLPDFELPDATGVPHRLSALQGGDAMVLHLGRRTKADLDPTTAEARAAWEAATGVLQTR